MNPRQRFIRKIVYACAIAVLLLPLSWLSQPETTDFKGGRLAQLRKENQLSQAALGEIDPASETIKLVTLGMRGVAANILWSKANYYKMTDDYVGMSATLEQIARLQPNFVSVWIFQGWNLAYNVSTEFDDYHDRYYWVMKGVAFLREGTKYNTKEPRLLSDIGETIAHKIGRSDEHVQFRRLFREDDDFNGPRPLAQRDNWLVAREEVLKGEVMVDQEGVAVKGKSPLLFYVQAPLYLIYYGEALAEEGTFGEVAKNAWKRAGDSWRQYADRDLPTQYNFSIRLSEKEIYDQKAQEKEAELERLVPDGLRETIANEKLAALSPEDREVVQTPVSSRTDIQHSAYQLLSDRVEVPSRELADRVTGANRAAALKAAEEATQARIISRAITGDRDIVNFDYWLLRCEVEPQDDTLEARSLIFRADKAYNAAQLINSARLYTEGFQKWRKVIDNYPGLLGDISLTYDLTDSINRYRSVLHQLDEPFPQPFTLQDVLNSNQKSNNAPIERPEKTPGEQGPTRPTPKASGEEPASD